MGGSALRQLQEVGAAVGVVGAGARSIGRSSRAGGGVGDGHVMN
jgi:hypothetical protein